MKYTFQYMWWDHFKEWIFDLSDGRNSGIQEIANWLVSDIQEAGSAQRMIALLRDIKKGKEKKGYVGTGNAHSIYAFDDSLFALKVVIGKILTGNPNLLLCHMTMRVKKQRLFTMQLVYRGG